MSSYFTAALKGEFKEVQTQTIKLREESDALSERFQLWIYSESLFSNEETDKDIEWDDPLALYAFGEARNIPHLKNSTINALINKRHGVTYIPSKKIKYVYQNTPSGSQLRKLFVDWSVHLGALSGGGCFQENRGDYPKDYLIDVVIAQHALAPSGKPNFTDFRIIRPNYQETLPVTTKTTAEKKEVSFPSTSTFGAVAYRILTVMPRSAAPKSYRVG